MVSQYEHGPDFQTPNEAEIQKLLDENDRLREALEIAEKELTHAVPGSCYSTGPMTGDPIQDLVACPGCAALAKVRAALTSNSGPRNERRSRGRR